MRDHSRGPAVTVVETLSSMEAIYGLSPYGGQNSERFEEYLRLVTERAGSGLQAYNPMAGEEALETVTRLLDSDAEGVAREAAEETMHLLECSAQMELAVVVPSPGLWTERLVTEAEHRLQPHRPQPSLVQMWAGEPCGEADVRREATAETVRLLFNEVHGPPGDVSEILAREGLALAVAGFEWADFDDEEFDATEDAVHVLGDSRSPQDILTVAYGDRIAEALGLPLLGLPEMAGCRYAARVAARNVGQLGSEGALLGADRSGGLS